MSTKQDHTRIAAELTDVFGPGAGSYTGAAGSSGREGETGSPGLQAVNVAGQLFNANNLKNSLNDINHALANAETLEEIDAAIAKAGKVSKTDQRIGTLGDIATKVGYAGAAGKALGGELGTGGSAAVTALKTNPYVGMASGLGSLFKKYDPINPLLNKGAELVNELPGMEYVNRGLQNLGTGIRKIPGTGTASRIAGGLSEFPDEILSVPAKIWRSFGDKAKAAAKSSREFALNDMFEEYAKNDPYSTPPGGWVGARTVPGGHGEREFNENIPFQAETKDLWEEYKNTDSYKTVLTAQQGIRDLEEIRGQEALKKLDSDRAISELADPVVNIQPVATHADLGIGTHYSDEYGTWDAQTGEKLDVPSVYDPAPGFPITEPIPFEPPAAPAMEQIYRQPKAVETAPTVRSDELDPMKRVRPEEVVTPRIMTPRRIRPQRESETASGGAFSSPAWQALDGPASTTNYSKAQAADLLGFNAPLRTASQYMDLDAQTKPKHNLRELTTGRNASSYKG